MSAIAPLRSVLLSAQAASGSTSVSEDCSRLKNLTFFVKTNGSPGAGTLIIEEADWDSEKESPTLLTWSEITTITITSTVGNSAQYAYHAPSERAYHFVRARIGTAVTSTTIDVVLVGNY